MNDSFIRTEALIGKENLEKLFKSRIAIFGIGGVGSYVVESLARSGIGEFILIDYDIVEYSNINRQLIATHNTLGKYKVDVANERIMAINPRAKVKTYKTFYNSNNTDCILNGCDYIVDAIDTVTSKLSLIEESNKKGINIISCMGTGNKLNPNMFLIDDIKNTSVCPLCRIMRKELKNRGINSLKVLYSKEKPIPPNNVYVNSESEDLNKKFIGSISFCPSVAGLLISAEVIKDIINDNKTGLES